jgi:hypothetical protein
MKSNLLAAARAASFVTSLLVSTPTNATTYGFTGNFPYAFTSLSCTGLGCTAPPQLSVGPISASISFNFDTTGLSGGFSTSTFGFTGGQIQAIINGSPFLVVYNGPVGTGFLGAITLENGVPTDWSFFGSDSRHNTSFVVALSSHSESVSFVQDFSFPFGQDRISIFASDPAPAPLPAALPLFATGLGALGLLGWRRKRKQAA